MTSGALKARPSENRDFFENRPFFSFFSYSEFFSGRFDTSGSMVPRLVPKILSKCAFCDGAVAGVGIGDSRSLITREIHASLMFRVLHLRSCTFQDSLPYSNLA